MAEARQELIDLFGQPNASHFTDISGVVELTGVGFFDFLHGQTGVAPNGIELQPVLSISRLVGIPVGPRTPGDYDCDDLITVADAVRLLAELAGTPLLALGRPCPISTGTNQGDRGNPTCDSAVDSRDALAILQIVVQLRVPGYCS